jgi:hypothetical protein
MMMIIITLMEHKCEKGRVWGGINGRGRKGKRY